MKKFVLKLEIQDDTDKRRALKTVSTLPGIDEIAIDMKGKKLTVIGNVDPVSVVSKLRKKNWPADIISVGPKEEPKKEEPKKEEAKKEEPKKEEGKKDEQPAKEEAKKEEPKKEEAGKEEPKKEGADEKKAEPEPMVARLMPSAAMQYYRPYYPPMNTYPQMNSYPHPNNYYYAHQSMEENPNACTIC